ncbi:MAG: ABC transporter permease [Clostridia bacterium]
MEENQISKIRQTQIYLGKCFRIFFYEKSWKTFISALIITLLIASVTGSDMFTGYKDTQNGAFALVCACIWIGLFNSIQSICKERDIIKREYMSGLNIESYIIAHLIYEMALCLVEALIVTFIVIITNFSNFPDSGVLLPAQIELYISFFLIIFASDALAIMISCIVKTTNTAMTIMPFVLIIQLVMSGMIFDLEGVASLVAKITISKWGLALIGVTSDLNSMYSYSSDYEYAIYNLLLLWLILIVFVAAYTFIGIYFLKKVDKDKR